MLYRYYLRFCASINYFFERVRKDDDPGIPALLFVALTLSVYTYGLFYVFELIIGRKLNVSAVFYYGVFILWSVVNYVFAFRKEQLYRFYKYRFNPWQAVAIILVGYSIMAIAGYYARHL